jgi:hypothetical protein
MNKPIQATQISILLTNGEHAIIDSEDFDKVKKYSWSISKLGYPTAIINSYKNGQKSNKITASIYLHRLILNFPSQQIDHIDNNKLNCQKKNLRFCTQKENVRNQSKKSSNTSGYKGVSWSKTMNKWEARINPDYKAIVLGYFDNKVDAAIAYDEAAKKYFGNFANRNFL